MHLRTVGNLEDRGECREQVILLLHREQAGPAVSDYLAGNHVLNEEQRKLLVASINSVSRSGCDLKCLQHLCLKHDVSYLTWIAWDSQSAHLYQPCDVHAGHCCLVIWLQCMLNPRALHAS